MNRTRFIYIIIPIIAAVAVLALVLRHNKDQNAQTAGIQAADQGQPTITDASGSDSAQASIDGGIKNETAPITQTADDLLVAPIGRPIERAKLKLFGTYITPKNSPVKPEKFTGFHTGVDFETFPEEADSDISIVAVCNGPLLVRRAATGYGGVAVQRCELDKQLVTVVYGHLQLSSVKPNVGDNLTAGQQLGLLGTGYSSETDGERKHLHLGIHKGSSVNIAGYVLSKSQLSAWLDPMKYFR